MSEKKVKTTEGKLKSLKRWRKFLTAIEVIFGIVIIMFSVIMFVPSAKTQLIKTMASTDIGKKIIGWFGSASYDESIFDSAFDKDKLKTNNLDYNYSKEYTNFVLYGVDSRHGQVDTSNSDSILIVSIHNTTGKVKMVSVYRDTLLGIYNENGQLEKYFKVNSAYSFGGPEGAINTLNMNLDLDITDYVTVNFAGVAKIIDTLGGIKVNLTDDELAQLNQHLKSTISSTGEYAPPVARSGKNIKLNGIQATTYCRIRKATFYDPKTGEAISNDFGRAARQRSVIMKLVERAKKASVTELTDMVKTVMDGKNKKDQIISTSFTFDEIVNLIPVIFDFELSGSEGFPSDLTTGTYDGASYVIAKGLDANVAELHKYLYNEKNYQITDNVNSINNYIIGYTGVSADSVGGIRPTDAGNTPENTTTAVANEENTDYDYDDKGKSEFY